jgi:hypothetical protein
MTITVDNVSKQIESFLLLLTQKERFVIERRFNLDKKEKATLEEIGQHYSVTRERIRQIEKNALSKLRRNLENAPLSKVSNTAFEILNEVGGVMREDLMLARLVGLFQEFNKESLQLILSIDKRFNRLPNTVNFHPFLMDHRFTEQNLTQINNQVVSILSKNKDTLTLEGLFKQMQAYKFFDLEKKTFASLILVDKKVKFLDENCIGLYDWRHINPRTLRDKIFYVLRKNKEAMHFVEIANKIVENNFDKKKINLQAVHNELIRHPDFILIGRGIYGLKEWGFLPGTVADIISSLLKKNKSMSQDEIIDQVLKQRKVKPITIILSLKNKAQFIRIGRKQYSLAA